MFLFKSKPEEFTSYLQVRIYCLRQAKKAKISLNEFVSKLPEDLFNHFIRVIDRTAYSEHTTYWEETEYRPKIFAKNICSALKKEETKREQQKEIKKINDAILSYGSENGAVISVEKARIHQRGVESLHLKDCSPDYWTDGYYIGLQHGQSYFLLKCIDTYKNHDDFMDYNNIETNKSSDDCVKKYLKETLGISQIKKPENEQEILKDILINRLNRRENKDFINFYLAKFLISEYSKAQKQKVQENIKKNKTKEQIRTRLEKNKQLKKPPIITTEHNR